MTKYVSSEGFSSVSVVQFGNRRTAPPARDVPFSSDNDDDEILEPGICGFGFFFLGVFTAAAAAAALVTCRKADLDNFW